MAYPIKGLLNFVYDLRDQAGVDTTDIEARIAGYSGDRAIGSGDLDRVMGDRKLAQCFTAVARHAPYDEGIP